MRARNLTVCSFLLVSVLTVSLSADLARKSPYQAEGDATGRASVDFGNKNPESSRSAFLTMTFLGPKGPVLGRLVRFKRVCANIANVRPLHFAKAPTPPPADGWTADAYSTAVAGFEGDYRWHTNVALELL